MRSNSNSWDFRRSITTARVLIQLGLDHGLALDDVLRHTGISRALLEAPEADIEALQEIQLMRNLQAGLPQILDLGLQAGCRYRIATYGLWAYAVMGSATVGKAISVASRMFNLTYALTDIVVERQGDLILSTYNADHLPADVRDFVADRDRAAVITLQRQVLGQPLPFKQVLMRGPEPAPALVAAYTELFGQRPLFNQAHLRQVLDASVMDQPLAPVHPQATQLCEALCRDLLERRQPRTGVAGSVRGRLLRTPGQIPDMEQIAAEMHMTSRTLRRHLTAEGVTFRDLLAEVRQTLTEELMASASLTHSEIAERLGYADVTTFIEAFRRWKGMAPSEYRRHHGLRAPRTRQARSRLSARNTA